MKTERKRADDKSILGPYTETVDKSSRSPIEILIKEVFPAPVAVPVTSHAMRYADKSSEETTPAYDADPVMLVLT